MSCHFPSRICLDQRDVLHSYWQSWMEMIEFSAGHLKSDTINAALQKIIEILSG